MKRKIKVIKDNEGKFLCYFRLNEYNEPVTAYTTEVFDALDINKFHMDAERIWQVCIIERNQLIENYTITATLG